MTAVMLDPQGLHSRAMKRAARALRAAAPRHFRVVDSEKAADLVVLYVIGADSVDHCRKIKAAGKEYVVVQCCLDTTGVDREQWVETWSGAALVWSYYPSIKKYAEREGFPFILEPFGVDATLSVSALAEEGVETERDTVVTTGYVAGRPAEAIEEVWEAARAHGLRVAHVGPVPLNVSRTEGVRFHQAISDRALRDLYSRSRWVGAMRYVEGLELPAAEGLSCGARPVVFDQPAMRYWYGPHARFVPELSGRPLVEALVEVMGEVEGVDHETRAWVRRQFDWPAIAGRVWDGISNPPALGEERA